MDTLKRIALALIIIGSINWGLIGFFNFDAVAMLFGGEQSVLSRFIYALVGLSGLYAITFFFTGLDAPNEPDRHARPDFSTEFGSELDEFEQKDDRNDRS